MPRGEKSKYTSKQKRKAEHIAEGYERNAASPKRRPRAEPGLPSIRNREEERSRAADAARRKAMLPAAKEVEGAERRAERREGSAERQQ